MALDPRYITSTELESFFIDKDTGEPLANGYVQFWQDASRTTPKLVYELTGSPPNYTYTALPNPIVLSNTGNFQDAAGNNIAVYYFPYDSFNADANLQLYYIAVFNADGVEQFTREAWPNLAIEEQITLENSNFSNQISNPQFANVLFNATTGLTLSYTGSGTSVVNIAPGWTLTVGYTGTSTVTVAQLAIEGSYSVDYPNNAPFALSITGGANIGSISLTQKINNDPAMWAPSGPNFATNGWVSTNVTLAPGTILGTSSAINYVPSSGAPTILMPTQSNGFALPTEYNNVVQLPVSTSTDTGATGYVNIVINIPPTGTTTFTGIQVVGVNNNTPIAYAQDTVARQTDFLFHYYNPQLQYKPIPSYLVGWDFPLNPAQFLGASVAAQAVGANKSYYAWDQTILFQTANSGITTSRDTSGALKTLSAQSGGTQLALIQYLPAAQAIEMLSRRKCVNVSANASVSTGATVSLWYTKGDLPSTVASNLSIVLTLDANGYPATQTGTWVPVPRSGLGTGAGLNGAQLTIGTNATASFNQYPLSGWDMQGATDINGATFFAIVVGTASLAHNAYILWQSISCQDGDIPTVPAPKTLDQVLQDCQYYWNMSFIPGVFPSATAAGLANGEATGLQPLGTSTAQAGPIVRFPTPMYTTPTAVTLYNPVTNSSAQIRNISGPSDWTGSDANEISAYGFYTTGTSGGTGAAGGVVVVNYTADARLGQ